VARITSTLVRPELLELGIDQDARNLFPKIWVIVSFGVAQYCCIQDAGVQVADLCGDRCNGIS